MCVVVSSYVQYIVFVNLDIYSCSDMYVMYVYIDGVCSTGGSVVV